ncbi:MAG: diguanylate cyclase [Myxococcales bacterium]|nr:diguanylate cyclase [Myxococcales bacterium]
MNTADAPIVILLATAPAKRADAEARVRATGLPIEIHSAIEVGAEPPDLIVVGADGWHATLSHLRAGFPYATRVVLGNGTGPTLETALRDGVHDVIEEDEPVRALTRSIRLGAYRAQMERRFSEISRRYRAAVHCGGTGTMRWDLSDRSMSFDPGWKAMLGYADDEHADDSTAWFSRVHPADQADLRHHLKRVLDGETRFITLDYRLQHRDGSWLWARLRLDLEKVGEGHFALIGTQEDITVDKVSEQRVAWADRHDSLTGLLGRSAFVDDIQDWMANDQSPVGVLGVCDIDGLKAINEAHGRAAGDEVLLWLGGLFEDKIGETGLTARLTGDKLGFLLPGITVDDAHQLAVDLRDELLAEIFIAKDGSEFEVHASFVVAAHPAAAEDAQEWLGATNRGLADGIAQGQPVTILRREAVLSALHLLGDDA